MKTAISIVLLIILQASGAAAETVPPEVEDCAACHGVDGTSSNPDWPSLAGQKREYLEIQLRKFRSGQRGSPVMADLVKDLSDREITRIANYYSEKSPRATASGNLVLVETGENLSAHCKACHGMAGQTANSEWPNLAGQQAAYIEQQLVLFQSGARKSSQMKIAVKNLGKEDFTALAAYYSQLEP